MKNALLLLTLVAGGCQKASPVEQPVRELPMSIDSNMQVVLLTPSEVPAQTPTPAQIVGTGFQTGAEVRIGDQWLSGVRFDNENQLSITIPAMPDGRYDVTVQNIDGGSGTMWAALGVGSGVAGGSGTITLRACQTLTLFFGLDQTGMDNHSRQLLDAEAECWQTRATPVRIEGHADERGTTDYNLALGQRRALAVRDHLSRMGLPSRQMSVVSYGEERPANVEHTEQAWSENRRVEVQGR